jgi:hypothetical protein
VRRSGDSILEAFAAAVAGPAERVVITGSLFEKPAPPAHLVDRVVKALVAAGKPVVVPTGTPRALLFLAAGITLADAGPPDGAPEFWRGGEYRLLIGDRIVRRRRALPGVREVRLDVTGIDAREVLARIGTRLAKVNGSRYVRVVLFGRTEDPGVASLGPRDLHMVLPAGIEGTIVADLKTVARPPPPDDEDARREALTTARARMPDLPETTGVYEFVDERERILYVGKAVNLRRRVASHFTAEIREPSPRGPMLMAAHGLRHREAPNELMALLAEARRIHEVRPPFNRQMRDPEAARYLRVDLGERDPGLSSEAEVRDDGATWYGPFPKRWAVERSLRVLQVVFGLKSCAWRPGRAAPTVCSDRDLSICAAPCTGRATPAAYRRRVTLAHDFLLARDGDAPGFGEVNPLSAGLLGEEDRRILQGFATQVRRFLDNLSEASGLVLLPGGRALLVLGGLVEEQREVRPDAEDAVREWADARIRDFRRGPPRTWLPLDRAEEGRILAFWLRARARQVVDGQERG